MIHTVHRTPTTGPASSTHFLNRVCSRTSPGNDQVNEPKAQHFSVTTGTPPEATLRGHPPLIGRHPQEYKHLRVLQLTLKVAPSGPKSVLKVSSDG